MPFLVLAVGVDNIYILVQALQKDPPKSVSQVPQQVGLGIFNALICEFSIIYNKKHIVVKAFAK